MPLKSKSEKGSPREKKPANAEAPIVVSLPADAERMLTENGVDLVAALRESGLPVQRAPVPPNIPKDEGTKEVLLAIIGVGVTASLVASGISKVLDALGRNKKFPVSQRKLMPVLDGKGNPVRDAKGKPLTYWTDETQLLEAKQTSQGVGETALELRPTMLTFRTTSGK